MSKKMIYVTLLLITLTVLITYLLLNIRSYSNIKNTFGTTQPVNTKKEDLVYPELPVIPNSEWKIEGYATGGEDAVMFSNEVILVNRNSYIDSYVKLDGPLHYTKILNISTEDLVLKHIEDFYSYYSINLDEQIWKSKIAIDDDHDLLGISSDGVQGSLRGYVTKQNNYIQSIILWHSIGPYSFSESGPPHLNCPCVVEFKVFESEPINIIDMIL